MLLIFIHVVTSVGIVTVQKFLNTVLNYFLERSKQGEKVTTAIGKDGQDLCSLIIGLRKAVCLLLVEYNLLIFQPL